MHVGRHDEYCGGVQDHGGCSVPLGLLWVPWGVIRIHLGISWVPWGYWVPWGGGGYTEYHEGYHDACGDIMFLYLFQSPEPGIQQIRVPLNDEVSYRTNAVNLPKFPAVQPDKWSPHFQYSTQQALNCPDNKLTQLLKWQGLRRDFLYISRIRGCWLSSEIIPTWNLRNLTICTFVANYRCTSWFYLCLRISLEIATRIHQFIQHLGTSLTLLFEVVKWVKIVIILGKELFCPKILDFV